MQADVALLLSCSAEKTRVLRIWKNGLPWLPRKVVETVLHANESAKVFRAALEAELAAGPRPQILDALTVEQEACVSRVVRRRRASAQTPG